MNFNLECEGEVIFEKAKNLTIMAKKREENEKIRRKEHFLRLSFSLREKRTYRMLWSRSNLLI